MDSPFHFPHERESGNGVPKALGIAPELLARSSGVLDAAAVDAMAVAVVLAACDGRVARANRRAVELLRCGDASPGAVEESISALRVLDPHGENLTAARLPLASALRGECAPAIGLVLQFWDGLEISVVAGAAPVFADDGTIAGAALTLTEVPPFPQARDERERLAHIIQHDILAPLGLIAVQAKILGRRSEPAAVRARRIDAIVAGAHRVTGLVEAFVESVLLDARRLHLELVPLDLGEFARDVRGRLPASYDAGRVRVEASSGVPVVRADPNRIERVLVNLVTDALDRSPPTSAVVVRVCGGADHVDVEVEDAGQAVAGGLAPRWRSRHDPADHGPVLGLYTARMLIEAHGGSITSSDLGGRGNVVRVRLPLQAPQCAASEPVEARRARAR